MIYIRVPVPVIYKITNRVTGKVYIGQTVDFDRRVNEYKNRNPHRSHSSKYAIMHVIQEYGYDNFDFDIIHTCKSSDELNYWEYYYIEKYKSYDPKYGYNSKHLCGDTERCNDTTREKMRISHTGLTEKGSTKRKKSKGIIAINDSHMYICDSSKLFADFVGSNRAIVSHAMRDCGTVKGFYIISQSKDVRDEKIKSCKNNKYLSYVDIINSEDVETIKTHHIVEYIKYDD